MDPTPRLVLNPSDDGAFSARATRLVAQGDRTADRLQAELRSWYPKAVVRRRDLSEERSRPTWYVYREGSWIPPRATA